MYQQFNFDIVLLAYRRESCTCVFSCEFVEFAGYFIKSETCTQVSSAW